MSGRQSLWAERFRMEKKGQKDGTHQVIHVDLTDQKRQVLGSLNGVHVHFVYTLKRRFGISENNMKIIYWTQSQYAKAKQTVVKGFVMRILLSVSVSVSLGWQKTIKTDISFSSHSFFRLMTCVIPPGLDWGECTAKGGWHRTAAPEQLQQKQVFHSNTNMPWSLH